MLNPGDTRIVLTWGSKPKDLDSYLTVPHSDPAKNDCVINYKNKVPFSVVLRVCLCAMPDAFLHGSAVWRAIKGLRLRVKPTCQNTSAGEPPGPVSQIQSVRLSAGAVPRAWVLWWGGCADTLMHSHSNPSLERRCAIGTR